MSSLVATHHSENEYIASPNSHLGLTSRGHQEWISGKANGRASCMIEWLCCFETEIGLRSCRSVMTTSVASNHGDEKLAHVETAKASACLLQ